MVRYHYFIAFEAYKNGERQVGNGELVAERMVTSYARIKEIEKDYEMLFGDDKVIITSWPHLIFTENLGE